MHVVMRWVWRVQSDQRGAGSVEYVGAVILVIGIVVAMSTSAGGVSRVLGSALETAVCAALDRCGAPQLASGAPPAAPSVNERPAPITQPVAAHPLPAEHHVDPFGNPTIDMPDGSYAPVEHGAIINPETGQPYDVQTNPVTGEREIVTHDGTTTTLSAEQRAIVERSLAESPLPSGTDVTGGDLPAGGDGPDGGAGPDGGTTPDGGTPPPGGDGPDSGDIGAIADPGTVEGGTGADGGAADGGAAADGGSAGEGGAAGDGGSATDPSAPGGPDSGQTGADVPGSGQGPTAGDLGSLTADADAPGGHGSPEAGAGNGSGLPGGGNVDQAHGNDRAAGDPVNTRTGAFVTAGTDLVLPGPGLPLELRRSYSSTDDRRGSLGRGWTHAYDMGIERDAIGRILVRTETGFRVPFDVVEDTGEILTPPGITSELRRVDGGGYELTRRDGRVVTFDSDGRATALRDRNGLTTTLTYDEAGRLTAVTDPVDRSLTLTWEGERMVGASLPDGRAVTYRYEADLLVEVVDLRGNSERYAYDAAGRISEIVDNNGNLVVRHTYDDANRVVSQTNGLGHTFGFEYLLDGPYQVTIYTDPKGNRRADVYAGDRLVRTQDALGHTTTFRYDEQLNPVEIIDANGAVHRLGYDGDGNLTSVQAPDPLGFTQTMRWGAFGNLTQLTDGEGAVTELAYDDRGNLRSVQAPDGGVTTLVYDHTLPGLPTAVTNPLGHTVEITYDEVGQLTDAIGPTGTRIQLTYDEAGHVVGFTDPEGFAEGRDPEAYRWTLDWDTMSHLTEVTDPLGGTTTFTYDAMSNLTSTTDANGNRTVYEYDSLHRLTGVTAPDTTTTHYFWDATDNLIQRRSATGEVTRYGYDAAGRLVGVVSPAGQRWLYERDATGNIVEVITPEGVLAEDDETGRVRFAYDPLGRPTTVDPSDAPTVQLEWDAANRVVAMEDALGTERYDYDAVGRLVRLVRDGTELSYSYDLVGNLVERVLDGTATRYSYDEGRLLVGVDGDDHEATYSYDAAGRMVEAVLGNGARTQAAYDPAGRIAKIVHLDGDGTLLSASSYALDPVGNPRQVRGIDETTTHVYDDLDRLVQSTVTARASGTQLAQWTYQYDDVGRRVAERGPEGVTLFRYAVGDLLREVEHPDGEVTAFEHDANGRRVAAGDDTFAFDVLDRLVSQTVAGVTTEFAHDGMGKRVSETSGDETKDYLWDPNAPNYQLAALRGADGDEQRFTLLPGAGAIGTAGTDGTAYLHSDGLGSVTAATGTDGSAQWRFGYEPFGAERGAEQLHDGAVPMPLRFTGQLLDEQTGSYHLRMRQYDPELGQFASLDPAGAFMHRPYSNAYGYVDNRPTYWTDPSGACPWCVVGAVAGAVIGGGAEIVKGVRSGDGVNWGNVGKAAVVGAVVGGVGVATMGLGLTGVSGYAVAAGVPMVGDGALQVWQNGGFQGFDGGQFVLAGVGGAFTHGMGTLLTAGTTDFVPSMGLQFGWDTYNSLKFEALMFPFSGPGASSATVPSSAARS
jgi:RHS repeat-associated protein